MRIMREFLFRGKRTDNGEWIKGGIYVQKADDVKDEAAYIIGGSLNNVGCAYPVDPETVGQYTGMTDKNGKKIFEGDIVLYSREEELGQIEYHESEAMFVVVFDTWQTDFDHIWACDVEIIDNIHDNPELLKGGAE